MGKKTHVMVIPFPSQGHINPMVQFSKRLASKGLKITILITPTLTKSIQIQTQPTSITILPIPDGFKEGEKPDGIESFVEKFKSTVPQILPDLIEKQNNSEFSLKVIVYDSFMPWVLEIAQQKGIYGASFFTQSAAVSSIYYHMRNGSLKIPGESEGGSMIKLPSMALMGVNDLPSFISDSSSYPAILGHVLNRFSNVQNADWLFLNTFDKLEDEVVNWMASQWPIKTIGPTIPSMFLDKRLEDDKDYGLSLFKPDAEACLKWLDTKETCSVVYVSFGSLANLGEEQMQELAQGLMSSNSYFLWVVRTSEEGKLPKDFMAEASEKGLIVNWCPQLEVLAHPAVGCFMTHCGWNSTLEALSLGVPMLAVPQWTDQPTNAKYIVDVWRAGVRVKVDEKGIITKEEIETCIKEVMEGERANELKKNAVRWKEWAKEAVDEGGSSDKNIDEFISKLVCT